MLLNVSKRALAVISAALLVPLIAVALLSQHQGVSAEPPPCSGVTVDSSGTVTWCAQDGAAGYVVLWWQPDSSAEDLGLQHSTVSDGSTTSTSVSLTPNANYESAVFTDQFEMVGGLATLNGGDPVVSVSAGDGITEGGDATFTITASPAPAADLSVSVTVSASGDYGATTGQQTVTIPTTGSVTLTVGTTNDDTEKSDGSVTATLDTPAVDAGYTVSSSQGAATVAVADDDGLPEVSIVGGGNATEGGDAGFTITANPAPAADLDVSVTVSASGDYGATTGQQTVTIPTTGSFTLTVGTTNDDVNETDGSVTATLDTPAADAGYTVSATQAAATVVVEDDDVPEVSISAGSDVTEGGDATFTITASPTPAADLDVSVTVSQSGDYAAATGQQTVTIPTTGSVTLTVGTTNDDADETDGSVTATLDAPAADAGYTVSSSQGAATVAVSDDDEPTPEVSISAGNGVTEGGDATFTLTASPAPAADLDVSVTVSASGDYGATTGKQTVTIPTTGSVTLTVGTINDGANEANGSVTATLDTPAADAGYTVSSSQGAATVSVSDDDVPEISISAGNGVTEGGDATFTLTANPVPASNLDVSLTVSQSGDYGATTGPKTVTISSSGSATFSVGTVDDGVDEADGSVTATLVNGADYNLGATTTASVDVADDDDAPVFTACTALPTVAVSDAEALPSDSAADFTISLDCMPSRAVTVYYSHVREGSIDRTDKIVLTSGAPSQTVSVEIKGTKRLEVQVVYVLGAPNNRAKGSLRIVSERQRLVTPPTIPVVSISGGTGVTEGGDATFTVTASPAPTANLDVSVTVSQSGDYGATTGAQTVTVPTTGSATFTVGTTDDQVHEPNGSVTATLVDGADYDLGTSKTATVSVADDDDPPVVTISGGSRITEGGNASFTVSATPAPSANLSVTLTVSASGDYGASTGTKTVVIPTSGSTTFTVGTTNDDVDEANGSVTATLVDGADYDLGATTTATVAVSDDDVPELSISAGGGITEGGDAGFTLTANPAPAADLDVSVTVSQSGDYGATTGQQTVTIPTTGSFTLVVGTTNDQTDESDGSVTATLDAPVAAAGYTVSATQSAATVAVSDDDVPEVSISAGSGVTEGGDATFTITASPAPAADLDVSVTVSQSGDYGATTGQQTVTIPATGSVTLTVGTTDDQTDEPNGSVTATINTGSAYTVSSTQSSGTVTVADDDDPPVVAVPVVTVSGGSGVTEGGNASFTVTATPSPSANLSVTVTISASGDYGASTGTKTVVIPTSGSATFTVGTTDDQVDEPNGSVTATLVDGTDYDLGTSKTATVAVADDDDPPVVVVPVVTISSGSDVTEGGNASFTVSATPPPSANLSVTVTVSASGDFGATTGSKTVTVPASGSATFTVGTTDDSTDETDGSVTATLVDGTDYDLGATTTATVAVSDDDVPSPPTIEQPVQPVLTACTGLPTISVSDAEALPGDSSADFTISLDCKPSRTVKAYYAHTREGSIDGGVKIVSLTSGKPSHAVSVEINGTKRLGVEVMYATGAANYRAKGALRIVSERQRPIVVRPSTIPVVSISGGGGITEGGDATFTVTASPAPTANLNVSVTVSASGDYGAATGSKTVTVPTSGSATFTVGTTNDQVDEPNGSVTATLVDGADYDLGTSKSASVTVADNDDPPVVVIPVVTISGGSGVTEGGSATFTLSASPAPSANLSVTVTVSASGDFGATTGSKTVTVPTSGSATFTVGTTNDQVDEPNGSVTATLVDGTDYDLGTSKTATVTVADNDDPPVVVVPVVTISGGSGVTEGGSASFTLSASPAPSANLSVTVTVSQSGDYGATTGTKTVTVPTSGSATFTVGTTNDQVDEPNGSVTATLVDGADYNLGTSKTATVTVADNDDPPVVVIPVVTISGGSGVTEGGDATFTLSASPAPSASLSVTVTVSQSGDYGATTGTKTVTVPASGSATFTVGTTNDGADEADGSVTATLVDGADYDLGATKTATVAVSDDDVPELSISAGGGITEGGAASFTITATPVPASPITVKIAVSENGDFGASGAATITVSGGSTTYTVSTLDDQVDEADGSVTATLKDGSGYTVSSSSGAATVAVADNDDPPAVELSVSIEDASGTEGTYLEFTVRLSRASTEEVVVQWSTATAPYDRARTGGRARSNDYAGAFDKFVFQPGVTELTGEVWLESDGAVEGDEYFAVELFLGEQWKFQPDATGIMTILDAD